MEKAEQYFSLAEAHTSAGKEWFVARRILRAEGIELSKLRILAAAAVKGRPIIGAICFATDKWGAA